MLEISRITILLVFLLGPSWLCAQKVISGEVIDIKTGVGIADVNLVVLGSTEGTTSNSDGSFEIETAKKKVQFVISHLSYGTKRIELSSNNSNIVELRKSIVELGQVNVGLGEYDGPAEFIPFNQAEYDRKLAEKVASYTEGEFVVIEDQPSFYGGMDNYQAYIASQFKY